MGMRTPWACTGARARTHVHARPLASPPPSLSHQVRKTYSIPAGDFPDVAKFRHVLATHDACRDFTKFKKLDDRLLQQLDGMPHAIGMPSACHGHVHGSSSSMVCATRASACARAWA